MKPIVCALLAFVSTLFRSRHSLQLEIVALRHQLTVYQRPTVAICGSAGIDTTQTFCSFIKLGL